MLLARSQISWATLDKPRSEEKLHETRRPRTNPSAEIALELLARSASVLIRRCLTPQSSGLQPSPLSSNVWLHRAYMCNAWNHPPGCTCGWGGAWYDSRVGAGIAPLQRLNAANYVDPYARCPVCACSVFYFQSPEGGRVLFDELGPPWPKHPCTDIRTPARGRTAVPQNPEPASGSSLYQWQKEGWSPFIVELVFSYSPILLRVDGTIRSNSVQLYVRKNSLPSTQDTREYLELSVVQSRQVNLGNYMLSILGPSLLPIQTVGFASSIEAASLISGPRVSTDLRRRRVRK